MTSTIDQQNQLHMPAEIFNPNPVVFSTLKSAGRKADLSLHSLWINDDSSSENEADDVVEAIDQDEVFGTYGLPFQKCFYFSNVQLSMKYRTRSYSFDL